MSRSTYLSDLSDTEWVLLEPFFPPPKRRAEHQEALIERAKHAENVLANWKQMSLMDQRSVAQAFISQIIVTPTGKRRVVEVEICWRDNSRETVVLPYRADKWVLWMPQEVEILTLLIQEHAAQVEIAAALLDRNRKAIRIKACEIIRKRDFHVSPKPIRDEGKYADYMARVDHNGEKANRTSGNRWQNDELDELVRLLDSEATQLEIAAALPTTKTPSGFPDGVSLSRLLPPILVRSLRLFRRQHS